MRHLRLGICVLILCSFPATGCRKTPQEVERPEKIQSIREVTYDSATYAKLAGLWEKYYDAYPSEDAYANSMYAAFNAHAGNAEAMIEKGVQKYPANPVLLYLSARSKDWGPHNLEGRQLLIKATTLDPDYMEPWFSLAAQYIVQGDRENGDVALRHLLTGGAIDDMVMDFNYNMIASLDTNAILITNGDNDTYPGWILTRIIRFRPDVLIVNRSLLNLRDYAAAVVKDGVPPFVTAADLDSIMNQKSAWIANDKRGGEPDGWWMTVGDRLVERIINACDRLHRPVYLACTVENYGFWKEREAHSTNLGLVTLVTSSTISPGEHVRRLLNTWATQYRTGGLDSWQLHASRPASASRALVPSYAAALRTLMPEIRAAGPDVQISLFRWYRSHIMDLLDKKFVDQANSMWFGPNRPKEVMEWSRSKGWTGD